MPDISLPAFQGPLDLLLHLIERDDLDVTAISLVAVTDQFLSAIRNAESFDPQALAEFIAIGAKLMYLKSKALLPRAPDEPVSASLEDDDVGRELVDLLNEYRRFGEVADMLQGRQEAGLRTYPRLAAPPDRPPGPGLDQVTVDGLFKLMLDVLKRKPKEAAPRAIVARETLTLHGQLSEFRDRLRRRGAFSFRRAVLECRSRVEVVVCFMAVLELLKSGECDARQSATWGDIEVVALGAAAEAS